MEEVMTTPVLRAKTSVGKAKFWRGMVLTDGQNYYRSSEAWTINNDGTESQRLKAVPALVKGKNIGRSNETSPREQAILEVNAKALKQQDKGYHEEGKEHQAGGGNILPMLAHQWQKKKHLVRFPMYVQPKYDGTRMLYSSELGYWSRGGKHYIPEVVKHIDIDTQVFTLDGELILPEGYTFQETMRAIKKYTPGLSELLIYRVYDIAHPDMDFTERLTTLENILGIHEHPAIDLAPTKLVLNESELMEAHLAFRQAGYEGTIIRTQDGLYTPGQRSSTLLKLKDEQDAEYEIVGFTDGIGKDAGTIIFQCSAGDKTFNVRPMGSYEERSSMYQKGDSYIGKMLTVKFQDLSEDAVPRFPVGIGIREGY